MGPPANGACGYGAGLRALKGAGRACDRPALAGALCRQLEKASGRIMTTSLKHRKVMACKDYPTADFENPASKKESDHG